MLAAARHRLSRCARSRPSSTASRRIAARSPRSTRRRRPSRRSAATRYAGDYLVLAAGSQPNFFKTPGAEHAFPLYSLDDADAPPDADHPGLRGGGSRHGPVGGRGARLRHRRRRPDGRRGGRRPVRDDQHDDGLRVPRRWRPKAKVHLVDHGKELLKMFADKAHAYTAGVLEKDGVDLRLGIGRRRDRPGPREAVGRVDDQYPLRRVGRRADGGAGGRRQRAATGSRRPDRREPGLHGRRLPRGARRSATSRTSRTGRTRRIPQLGSVALQSGSTAAKTILALRQGKTAKPFYVPRQGDDGDDRPRGGRRPGPWRGAARQARVRGLARRPRRADDGRQQPRRRVQDAGPSTTSARSARPKPLDRSGAARMQWEEDDAVATAGSAGGAG